MGKKKEEKETDTFKPQLGLKQFLSSVPYRSLKTQPIKGRLGDVFKHPDIASSHIDDVSTAVTLYVSHKLLKW